MRCVLKYLSVVCLFVVAGVHTAFAQYDKDAFFMRGRRALADGKYAQAIENFNIIMTVQIHRRTGKTHVPMGVHIPGGHLQLLIKIIGIDAHFPHQCLHPQMIRFVLLPVLPSQHLHFVKLHKIHILFL